MENSVYYVASPEACAAILWKSRDAVHLVGGLARHAAANVGHSHVRVVNFVKWCVCCHSVGGIVVGVTAFFRRM
eukprot:scaffold57215_cov20-Tisochrysis_lutea.AAC.6